MDSAPCRDLRQSSVAPGCHAGAADNERHHARTAEQKRAFANGGPMRGDRAAARGARRLELRFRVTGAAVTGSTGGRVDVVFVFVFHYGFHDGSACTRSWRFRIRDFRRGVGYGISPGHRSTGRHCRWTICRSLHPHRRDRSLPIGSGFHESDDGSGYEGRLCALDENVDVLWQFL